KRLEKLKIANEEIPEERRVSYYGSEDDEILLVGWGFTKGVVMDTLNILNDKGIKAGYLHIRMFSPFPSKFVKEMLNKFEENNIIAIEHNYLAQAAEIIHINTGIKIKKNVIKYNGRPIYLNELVGAILRILEGEDRVVLKYGP
ncbi:MAG: 2-oxoacid:acceptor oxidoreductase subunit alpha, partial [Candidatus Aenigmatarchaeota archaeon]